MPHLAQNDISKLWQQVKEAYADFTLAVNKYHALSARLKGRLTEIKDKKQLQAIRDSLNLAK